MRLRILLGAIAILLGIFGLVHQKFIAGMWFSWPQFWHHEPLIAIAICVGVALIVTSFIGRSGVHGPRQGAQPGTRPGK